MAKNSNCFIGSSFFLRPLKTQTKTKLAFNYSTVTKKAQSGIQDSQHWKKNILKENSENNDVCSLYCLYFCPMSIVRAELQQLGFYTFLMGIIVEIIKKCQQYNIT